MFWTVQHSATTQSLEAWGMSRCALLLRGDLQPSTFSFAIAGYFDAATGLDEGETVTLRDPDDVVRFVGKIRELPKQAGGSNEQQLFVCEDVLGDLDRRLMQQEWNMIVDGEVGAAAMPKAVLFDDGAGGFTDVAGALEEVIDYAASVGVSIQFGTAADMTASPHHVDVKGLTMLETIRTILRFSPDTAHRVDYTTTPPTINFIRRINADEVSLPVIEQATDFTCKPLHRQKLNGVVIIYETQATLDGQVYLTTQTDRFPAEATGTGENEMVYTVNLRKPQRQAQSQSQQLTVRTINADSFSWWEKHFPWLADRNEEATLSDDDVTPGTYSKEITAGATPDWTGAGGEELVTVVFNGIVNGKIYVGKELKVIVHATDLSSGTYTRDTASNADPLTVPPAGLAEQLMDALGVLHWQGSHTETMDELTSDVLPGDAVNFTGTANSALTTCRAAVQSVSLDIDSGTRVVEFGAPTWLPFNDLVDLLGLTRNNKDGSSAAERASGEVPTTLTRGVSLAPKATVIQTEDYVPHPFKVSPLSPTGNSFRVESGQIDGYTIPAETINVGATRPVAIRIFPTYICTVFDGEYFSTAVLKTATDAPVLETATGTGAGSDVTSMTSAGTQSRCVLATIAAGNVVSQLATANIYSDIDDDGGEDGTAEIQFVKS